MAVFSSSFSMLPFCPNEAVCADDSPPPPPPNACQTQVWTVTTLSRWHRQESLVSPCCSLASLKMRLTSPWNSGCKREGAKAIITSWERQVLPSAAATDQSRRSFCRELYPGCIAVPGERQNRQCDNCPPWHNG